MFYVGAKSLYWTPNMSLMPDSFAKSVKRSLSIMLSTCLRVIWTLVAFAFSVNALPPLPTPQGFVQTRPPLDLEVQAVPSITNQSLNASSPAANEIGINCNGERFGRRLNVRSCRGVFSWITTEERQITFSCRHSGVPGDIGLPWRVYSSKSIILSSGVVE